MALHRKRKKVLFFCFGNLRISEWWNLWIEKKPSAKTIKMCFMLYVIQWFSVIIPVINTLCKYPVITELIAALILMMIIVKKKEIFFFFFIFIFFDSLILCIKCNLCTSPWLFSSKNQSKKKSDSSNHWFCILAFALENDVCVLWMCFERLHFC